MDLQSFCVAVVCSNVADGIQRACGHPDAIEIMSNV